MAKSVIGALSVEITADNEGLKKGIKGSAEALEIGAKQMRSKLNDLGKQFALVATAAAGIGAAIVKTNLTAIRELKNLAFAANTTVEEFQRGAFAAQQFGIEQEKYGDILKDVTERVGDFVTEGAGPMTRFFEQVAPKVGITAKAFQGLSGQQALGLYIESLEKANLTQQEMTVFMEDIASDSTRLIPLFQNNAKALNEMSDEAKNLGIGLSAIDVQKAEMANEALAKSAGATDALIKDVTIELAPIIGKLTEMLSAMGTQGNESANLIGKSLDGVVNIVGVFADGLHGVQIIFKTLEVAALGFSALATKVFQGVATVIATSIDGWVMMINDAINDINSIVDTGLKPLPSVRDSEFMQSIHTVGDNMRGLVSETNAELHNLLMEDLPSEGIKAFVATAQEEFQKVAQARVDAQAASGNNNELDNPAESKEVLYEKDKTLAIIEELRSRFDQENELQSGADGKFASQQEMLEQALANQWITKKQFADAEAQLEKDKQRAILDTTTSAIDAAAQALMLGGKKTQKIGKNLAIVAAVIKGKQAAVDAWQAGMSTGGPWAPAVAAAYTAASIARTTSMISSIKGGGKSMAGMSAGGSISPPSNAQQTATGQEGQQSPQRNVTINLAGSGMFSADQVRELIGQINEQVGDGVELVTGA
jgi:hypothetical protein